MVIAVGQRPERVYENSDPEHPSRSSTEGRYGRPMTTTVHQVAAALRSELPGLPDSKLRRLLYYCQAHHLALTGQPMFDTHIVADPDGPAPAVFPYEPRTASSATTTTSYCYPSSAGTDASPPTTSASSAEARPLGENRRRGDHRPDKMRAYFTGAGAPDDTDPRLTDPGYRHISSAASGPNEDDPRHHQTTGTDSPPGRPAVSTDDRWTVSGFEFWIDRWIKEKNPPGTELQRVSAWILDLEAEPAPSGAAPVSGHIGMTLPDGEAEPDFDGFFHARIPGTSVTVTYDVDRATRTVTCRIFDA